MVKNPVTGEVFDPRTAVATREHGGQVLYFNSQESLDTFDDDPHFYGHPEEIDSDTDSDHHGH